MNLYRVAPLAASAAAAIATPAWAQDDRDTHFDGPYVSGTIGMAAQSNDGGDTLVFDTDGDGHYGDAVTAGGTNAFNGFCHGSTGSRTPGSSCGGDNNRIEYAGRIGYDKRLNGGDFVLGGLLEVAKSNSRDYTSGYSTAPNSYQFRREMDYAVSARARAGFTPGGGALFYATGGASWGKINHDFATTDTDNSFAQVNDGKHVWGWQAGGGGEVMVTKNVSLGLEYLYNRYSDNKYYVLAGHDRAAAGSPFVQASSDGTRIRPSDNNFDYHSLRATVSLQF